MLSDPDFGKPPFLFHLHFLSVRCEGNQIVSRLLTTARASHCPCMRVTQMTWILPTRTSAGATISSLFRLLSLPNTADRRSHGFSLLILNALGILGVSYRLYMYGGVLQKGVVAARAPSALLHTPGNSHIYIPQSQMCASYQAMSQSS